MLERALIPRSAFADIEPNNGALRVSAPRCGVVAIDCEALDLAIVLVRKGQLPALTRRVRECFQIELPLGPQRSAAGEVAFIGIAPDGWLVTRPQRASSLPCDLKDAFGALASITDQSDGYSVLRVTGPNVRQALAKIVAIDLHPRAFRLGEAAVTAAAHMSVICSRLEDAADGSPVFEIAMFRSFAASFWHALQVSAAEFGLALTRQVRNETENPAHIL